MEKRIKTGFTPDIASETIPPCDMKPADGEGRIRCHSGYFPATAFRGVRGRDVWKTGWSAALPAPYDVRRIQEWLS